MLVVPSGCCKTLTRMGNDDNVMVLADAEEGEMSGTSSRKNDSLKQEGDSSMEVKQTAAVGGDVDGGVMAAGKGVSNGNSRVWTMRDLLTKYPGYRGYANSGLYNFAWAQAVQNKPLNQALGIEYELSEEKKESSESKSEEADKTMIVDSNEEKEDGELEEGEIDMESAPDDNLPARLQTETESVVLPNADVVDDDRIQKETRERHLENKVKLIRGILESTSLVEAKTAFEGVCSRLMGALESLQELISDNDEFPKRDTLVQLSFAALQTINSVFCSMNNISKELNKEIMSSLLSLVNDHFSRFLSSNQINEIEAMKQNLSRSGVKLDAGTGSNDSFLAKNFSMEATQRGASYLRSRVPLLPLLDLHKDHDADSLPSPTRETTPSIPLNSLHSVRHLTVKPNFPASKEGQTTEGTKGYLYESEALKAVSTYQQKFGLNSLFKTDDLPSPTPSGEPNDGNGDISGEISSSIVTSLKPGNPLIYRQDVPLPSNFNTRSLSVPNAVSSTVPSSYLSIPGTSASLATQPVQTFDQTVKPSAKRRDPRLRFAKPDGGTLNQYSSVNVGNLSKVDPRKQKANDELFIDGPERKRQRSGWETHERVKDAPKATEIGGWPEDTETSAPHLCLQKPKTNARIINNGVTSITTSVMPPTSAVSVSQKVSETASTGAASLSSILKDIAVNPAMLLSLLKMGERQKVSESVPQKLTDPRRAAQLPGSSVPGVAPPLVMPASKVLDANLTKSGLPLDTSQNAPSDESGNIRMKPRDPRRILHGTSLQRNDTSIEKQSKVNESHSSGTLAMKGKTEEKEPFVEAPSKIVPRQIISQNGTNKTRISGDLLSGKTPDISTQFTKNLKNIADMVVVSQAGSNPPEIPHSGELNTNKDIKIHPSNSNDHVGTPVTATAGLTRSLNSWGDVEHLFEGYDDTQRVAIQKERARRLEEQKNMFASRKLSLVLDLDHTLLNSAKFHEVEPAHEEILRKKEEQDREKPYRHLFRFPHMGMWTKLRPGIWNFLEKASKLYELHLSTMGNKMYATEMAKVLDPKGTLFKGRVISKGDDGDFLDGDERVPKSKDLEGVMGMESSVVIIDDSVRMWPHHKMNLIAVERYTYFPCSRRQFGLHGFSLLEIDHDERPEEGTLASSLAVIEKIHQNFFSHSSLDEADVRNILASEQQKILAGCRIVFSRIIPVGEAKPHLHPLWQTAEQFGAVCTTQVDEQVTHVVTNTLGTDKVNWALTRGRYVVHHGWVEASAFLYRRANENDFAIKP